MPIYHSYRVIYIHIPKTGGTSIEKYFGQQFSISKVYPEFLWGNDREKGVIMHHLTCQQMLTLGYVSTETFSSYLKFAIVRNPYDRLVSEYHLSPKWRKNYPTFADFVRALPHNINTLHFMPQHTFICDANGNLMVDKVIKFENYSREVQELLDSVGILRANTDQKYNDREHKPWHTYYTDELYSIVHSVYQKDFE